MFQPTGFSEKIFKERYAFTEQETWQEACSRVAKQTAIAEEPSKQKKYEEKFNEILVNNLFVPGGRIWANSGRMDPQLLNCFILDNKLDSRLGWGNIAKEMIITSMTGGGCVDADTEYFTGNSWKKISEYDGGLVGQYNNGILELVTPLKYIKIPAKKLSKFKTKYGIDQVLCDEHRVIYENVHNGKLEEILFSNLKSWHNSSVKGANIKFLTTFSSKNTGISLSENEIRLMVAYVADGSPYNKSKKARFIFNKERKHKRLLEILNSLKYKYTLKFWKNQKLPAIICDIPRESKIFDAYYYNCNSSQLKTITKEIIYWDGTAGQKSRLGSFSTSVKQNADFIQYAYHVLGLRASINLDGRSKNINYRVLPTTRTKPTLCSDRKNKTIIEDYVTKDGFKYCFSVPSRTLILRRNNNIFITGNCGIDFSDVRPRGASIGDQRGECPGPVELMRLVDNCAAPVRSGGARRVALMFSLDLSHPDIEEFLDAKLEKGQLSHANVSVRCKNTSEFIKAVKKDLDWELSWKGRYKKIVRAKDIWSKIAKNAYNSAEPGFLNLELANNESNIWYDTELVTSNPCGEIIMPSHDSCCLGHIVLSRFVENEEFNWELLRDTIRYAVRFLDNVLSVNTYPLPEMKAVSTKYRRIGLGVTALADCVAILGHKYGSEDGNKFVEKLFRFISKNAYESSIHLAMEKGAFAACDRDKITESGFIKRLPPKIRSLIKEHGIRNCALLTLAPTGTVSILSGNCSSGIESMFAAAYERRYWVGNKRETELVFHPLFDKFMKEGKSIKHFVGTHDLSVQDHLEVQKIVQKYVDNAVSKTINIAEDYSFEEVEKLWLEYLPYLKGTTFYRENTRGYVDEKGNVQEPPLTALTLDEAKNRYKEKQKVEAAHIDDCPGGVCDI